MTEILHVLQHAFHDSINMVPFLFIAYVIIEYMEHHASAKMKSLMMGFGKFGPFGGAALGCVPQCGFAASAANLYANKVITLGTLTAVLISASDEAIPMLLSNPSHSSDIVKLIVIKIVIATIVGFAVDIVFKSTSDIAKSEIHHKHKNCCHNNGGIWGIWGVATKHTVCTYIFVFIISLCLGGAMEALGEEKVAALFMANTIFQPFIAALVGFIPNCASSVLLTQLYINGTLSFGSLLAGLCTGAGVALAVLFKENRPMKDNFKIMAITYIAAVIAGLIF